MTRQKKFVISGAVLAGVALLAGAGILVLRSSWFNGVLRQRLVETVETATGGRAEVGSFDFDWKRMRVMVRQFTLHGTEPAGKPPLIQASSAAVGLEIVSLLRRDVNLRYLEVQEPRVYLIVYPDGRTNVPEPPVKRNQERSALDTLINLAIGRFEVNRGVFEIEGQAKTPFDARGQNLQVGLNYEPAGPRYRGTVSIQPMDVRWGGAAPLTLGLQTALTLEKERVNVLFAHLTSGGASADISGSIENWTAPRAQFHYQAVAPASELARWLEVKGVGRGTVRAEGSGTWSRAQSYSAAATIRVADGNWTQASWQVAGLRATASATVNSKEAVFNSLRFSAQGRRGAKTVPVEGSAATLSFRGTTATIRGLAVEALGGKFSGEGQIENFDRFQARGELSGLDAKRAVALYSRDSLPWDSTVAGTVEVEGAFRHGGIQRVATNLLLAPAGAGAPVHGQLAATYDAKTGTLDLGNSTVVLPASRADFSGSLGKQIRVHLETRDLKDLLPVLGDRLDAVPLRLENGSAVFDGAVTGRLDAPRVNGRLTLTRFAYADRSFDSLQTGVNLTPAGVQLQDATLARGSGRAQFQIAAGLRDWQIDEAAPLSGSATLRNISVQDLLALANERNVPATGTLAWTGQISGKAGAPEFAGSLEVTRGSFRAEPFDRFTARVTETAQTLQVASGQLAAGRKQLRLEGTFEHAANRFDRGRIRLQVSSNALPLEEIRTLVDARPGVKGTLQISAAGDLELAVGSKEPIRLTGLTADITGRGLQLTGQPLGDAHLTAISQGQMLQTHLETAFANSTVRGDGAWRLEGDYPGTATIRFSHLDLPALRDWLAPSPTGTPYRFTGFAEGEMEVNGPALRPGDMQAELRIPHLEVRPTPNQGLVIQNSGPILASLRNATVTIESAKLTGKSTDFSLTGKIALNQRNPLDLRVQGQVDLGVLQALNMDLQSSGTVTADAAVRGPLNAPQLNGRLEVKDAAVSYKNLPNGLTNTNGVLLFNGDRATIQKLEGETGGGTVQLSGFAGYNGGSAVFRLHADTKEVRVRYPEGVSTVADAQLDFTGTSERSMLAGTITIRRASVNVQSDFGTVMARSSEPVRTPATATGFLAGLNYDVQVQTAPDIQFESAVTQGVQFDANLRVRGTAANRRCWVGLTLPKAS